MEKQNLARKSPLQERQCGMLVRISQALLEKLHPGHVDAFLSTGGAEKTIIRHIGSEFHNMVKI